MRELIAWESVYPILGPRILLASVRCVRVLPQCWMVLSIGLMRELIAGLLLGVETYLGYSFGYAKYCTKRIYFRILFSGILSARARA